MKHLIIITILTLTISLSLQAEKDDCKSLDKKLEKVTGEIKRHKGERSGKLKERKFYQKKLQNKINKKCVVLDKKIEDAFGKSSLISQ